MLSVAELQQRNANIAGRRKGEAARILSYENGIKALH